MLGLLGIVIGFYCGPMILIPLAGGIIAWLLALRFAPVAAKSFIPALAVIFGHVFWMLFGVMLAHTVSPVLVDLLIMVAGLLWLTLRPGLGPVILLCIYEAISLVMNIAGIIHLDFNSELHRAYTAHIALHVFALATLIGGYLVSRGHLASKMTQEAQNQHKETNERIASAFENMARRLRDDARGTGDSKRPVWTWSYRTKPEMKKPDQSQPAQPTRPPDDDSRYMPKS